MQILQDHKYIEAKKILSSPNIFKILSLENYEIRHSNFLGWLLDSNETHQCGNLFQKSMLAVLFPDFTISSSEAYFNVSREKNNIDIQLDNEKTVLVIENKIKAKDHKNQLYSYRIRTDRNHPNKNQHFTYLTLFGEDPQEKNESKFWNNVSYVDLISCIKETIDASKDISNKTRTYIDDYIFSMELHTLGIHEVNKASKHLAKKYQSELYECFKDSFKGINNKADLSTLKFIKSQTTFARGEGFFRKTDIYYEAFSYAFKKLGFHLPKKGNSTYFVFYPNEFKNYEINMGHKLPFDFNLRFNEENKTMRLAGNINEGDDSNQKVRQQLINKKDSLKVVFKNNFIKAKGKLTIGVYSKILDFNPMDYDKNTLNNEIIDFVESRIALEAKLVAKEVIKLINS